MIVCNSNACESGEKQMLSCNNCTVLCEISIPTHNVLGLHTYFIYKLASIWVQKMCRNKLRTLERLSSIKQLHPASTSHAHCFCSNFLILFKWWRSTDFLLRTAVVLKKKAGYLKGQPRISQSAFYTQLYFWKGVQRQILRKEFFYCKVLAWKGSQVTVAICCDAS